MQQSFITDIIYLFVSPLTCEEKWNIHLIKMMDIEKWKQYSLCVQFVIQALILQTFTRESAKASENSLLVEFWHFLH